MYPRVVALRALPLVGLVASACFAAAPEIEVDSTTSDTPTSETPTSDTGTSDSTVADTTTTGTSPTCMAGEVAIPIDVPEGWSAPAWVAIGEPGVPPPRCPEATAPGLLFLGASDKPGCACACDAQSVCGTTHSSGPGCDGVEPHGAVNLCTDLPAVASAIDLSVTPVSTMCSPAPQPVAPGATAVAVCQLPGNGDGCESPLPGFVGPCIVGDAECPAGYAEFIAPVFAVECAPCESCEAAKYCDIVRYELFAEADCAGEPITSTTPEANCTQLGQGLRSLRAIEVGRVDTGCEPAEAAMYDQRVCCVSE